MPTKEQIAERLELLRASLRQMQSDRAKLDADIHATDGAVQECEYWLSQCEDRELVKDG